MSRPRTVPDRPPGTPERRKIEALLRGLPDGGGIPRREGELSFREPWEVRTLGIIVQLYEQGLFEWSEFQGELIAVIADWEALPADERTEWSYYACWQQAAERLLAKKSLIAQEQFDERADEFLSGKRTPPHTHGGGLLSTDPGTRAAPDSASSNHEPAGRQSGAE